MQSFLNYLGVLFQIELRSSKNIFYALALALLVGAISGLGLRMSLLSQSNFLKAWPSIFWTCFFLNSLLFLTNSFEREKQNDIFYRLKLANPSLISFFISKLLLSFGILLICFLIQFTSFSMVSNAKLLNYLGLVFSGSLAILAFSCLGLIGSIISSNLPLNSLSNLMICLPLCIPLFYSIVEIWIGLLLREAELVTFWFGIVLLIALAYTLIGIFLFRFSVSD